MAYPRSHAVWLIPLVLAAGSVPWLAPAPGEPVTRRTSWCPTPEMRMKLTDEEVLERLREIRALLDRVLNTEDGDASEVLDARDGIVDLICDYDLARSPSR